MIYLLLIALGVFVVVGIVRGVRRGTVRAAAQRRGESHCRYCGKRMKALPSGGYATTCRGCGRDQ